MSDLGGGPGAQTGDGGSGTGAATEGGSAGDTGGAEDAGGNGDGQGPPPPGPPGGDACPGLECLPCGQGRGCADATPILEGTCCAEGDSLVHRARGSGAEIVDIEVQGDLAVTCGGFGATIENITNHDDPFVIAAATARCQHAAFGPDQGDAQVIYFTHHGDTWVDTPFLAAFRVNEEGSSLMEMEQDPTVLFEGVVYHEGNLYVAAHGGGLRVYTTDAQGIPALEKVIDGFDNATKPAVHGDHLYVADGVGGIRVLSLADPLQPEHVGHFEIPGMVRDVFVDGDRALLALGGDGVEVVDVSIPSAPLGVGHIETRGTAQAVSMDDEIIAIAAWSHVAVHDRETLQLLATERVRSSPSFEQDVAVEIQDGFLYVGEWTKMHVVEYRPGYVAPDLWVDEELLGFSEDEPSDRVLAVRNRGYLDLDVLDIELEPPFSTDKSWLRVPPRSARALEIVYEPPPPDGGTSTLRLHNNDPDASQNPTNLPLVARDTSGIDVGDTLTEEFAFLDPTGSPQLQGLRGKVVVLAYFALF
ncbi:MAG: hypothetical protein AAF799_01430 [Myxococcota bacterium]